MADQVSITLALVDKMSAQMQKPVDSMKRMEASVGAVQKAMATMAGAAGVGLVTKKLYGMVSATVDAADAIDELTLKTGLSVQTIQGLTFAAGQNKAGMDSLEKGLKALARQAYDARDGVSTAVDAFGALGVKVDDETGTLKDLDKLLFEVSDGLSEMASVTEQSAISQELLGRAGTELLPLLSQGSERVNEYMRESLKLNKVTDDLVKNSAELMDNLVAMEEVWNGLKNALSADFIERWAEMSRMMRAVAGAAGAVRLKVEEMIPSIGRASPIIDYFLEQAGKAFDIMQKGPGGFIIDALVEGVTDVAAGVDGLASGQAEVTEEVEKTASAYDNLIGVMGSVGITEGTFGGLKQPKKRTGGGKAAPEVEPLDVYSQLGKDIIDTANELESVIPEIVAGLGEGYKEWHRQYMKGMEEISNQTKQYLMSDQELFLANLAERTELMSQAVEAGTLTYAENLAAQEQMWNEQTDRMTEKWIGNAYQIEDVMRTAIGGSIRAIGDGIANELVDGTNNWKAAMKGVLKQVISVAIQMLIVYAIQQALKAALKAASGAATGGAGSLAGTMADLAPSGANDGLGGLGGATGGTAGLPFHTGGYVKKAHAGELIRNDETLRRLQFGEFVMNAPMTSRFLPQLQAMNSGRAPSGQTTNNNMTSNISFAITTLDTQTMRDAVIDKVIPILEDEERRRAYEPGTYGR